MDKIKGTIKALSLGRKSEGSIGFMLKEKEGQWINVDSEEKILDKLLETIIRKGNVIEFEFDNGFPRDFTLIEKATETMDDLITFEELLADAHEKFDTFSIKTTMVENDWEKQRAIFKAKVIVTDGELVDDERALEVYEAHGDATQENCGSLVKMHYIRMAETRAISRALRWATNNAKAAKEETEDGELTDEQMQSELAEEQSKP